MKKVIFILIMLTMTAGLFAQDMPAVKGEPAPVYYSEKSSAPASGNYLWIQMPGWHTFYSVINVWLQLPGRIFNF